MARRTSYDEEVAVLPLGVPAEGARGAQEILAPAHLRVQQHRKAAREQRRAVGPPLQHVKGDLLGGDLPFPLPHQLEIALRLALRMRLPERALVAENLSQVLRDDHGKLLRIESLPGIEAIVRHTQLPFRKDAAYLSPRREVELVGKVVIRVQTAPVALLLQVHRSHPLLRG